MSMIPKAKTITDNNPAAILPAFDGTLIEF